MKKKKAKKRKLYSYEKKSIVLGIMALFVVTFLFGVFSFSTDSSGAITKNTLITGHALFGSSGGHSLNSIKFWNPDIGSGGLVRWIMFFIVLMFIYWAIDTVIENKSFIKIALSGAIAYLAVNFIVINEIYSIMTTYSALGVTFTVIAPFIVILLFTTRLVSTGVLKVPKIFTERVIWFSYSIFLIYYLWTSDKSSTALNWIILLIVLVSVLITIFNSKFIKYVRKMKRSVDQANQDARLAESKLSVRESKHNKEMLDYEQKLQKQKDLSRDLRNDIDKINKDNGTIPL